VIIKPLIDLHHKLKSNSNLNAYLLSQFNKPGRFVIGQYKPQNIETDYPFISLTVQGEVRDASDVKRDQVLTVYWAIHQPDTDPVDSDIYSGVIQLAEIGDLIEQCLYDTKVPNVGFRVKHEGETYNDFAVNYPFFAAGSQFTLHVNSPI